MKPNMDYLDPLNNGISFLLDEMKLSRWAYWYCKNIEDSFKIRRLITISYYSFLYCDRIKYDLDVEKNITKYLKSKKG